MARTPTRFLLPLLIGWLPMWALYTTLILTAHPGATPAGAAVNGFLAIGVAAALGLLVQRLADRLPWPRSVRPGFVAAHVVAAVVYGAAWLVLTNAVTSLAHGHLFFLVAPSGVAPFLLLGAWLYVMVAGVVYTTRATERAAHAEAIAARSRLAALRAQLNPHFLFNALHTVVQLIPRAPVQAAQAAERLAGLLRTGIEEDRDLVPLADEWAFVERYLDLERIRFGERLAVRADLAEDARGVLVPPFALQTLVENAVRHGAAPRVEPTTITIEGRLVRTDLVLVVRDDGAGAAAGQVGEREGTGLSRLRDRLAALYAGRARLEARNAEDGGFIATLTVPGTDAAS